MKCWACDKELIWGGDHDIEEDDFEQEHTMITNLSCSNCNAFVEVYHGTRTEAKVHCSSQLIPWPQRGDME